MCPRVAGCTQHTMPLSYTMPVAVRSICRWWPEAVGYPAHTVTFVVLGNVGPPSAQALACGLIVVAKPLFADQLGATVGFTNIRNFFVMLTHI